MEIRTGVPNADDAARVSKQAAAILTALLEQPQPNTRLVQISRKYSSRLAELRDAGWQVECYNRDHKTGLAMYRLLNREPSLRTYLVQVTVVVLGVAVAPMTFLVPVRAVNRKAAELRAAGLAVEVRVAAEAEDGGL
jgi:hypothetical protein